MSESLEFLFDCAVEIGYLNVAWPDIVVAFDGGALLEVEWATDSMLNPDMSDYPRLLLEALDEGEPPRTPGRG